MLQPASQKSALQKPTQPASVLQKMVNLMRQPVDLSPRLWPRELPSPTPPQKLAACPPEPQQPEPTPPIPLTDMVLQWQGLSLTETLAETLRPAKQSADYLVAMHQLVRRIAQLKAAQGIESASVLFPLVKAEAEEVLRKQTDWRLTTLTASSDHHSSEPMQMQTWSVCAVRWLWWIAQSTHEMLSLLEGCPVQLVSGAERQTGVARLVVLLELEPDSSCLFNPDSFDLVTASLAPDLLPETQQLILDGLGQYPTVKGMLQHLIAQILTAAPVLRPFFQGLPAHWLLPHQAWQAGTLGLRLGFTFTPTPIASPSSLPAQPSITFSQPNWLEQHVSIAVGQQLTQILLQNPLETSAEAVVAQGCAAIDRLQTSLTLASRTFAQESVTLEALALRLQWGINRTAYEVMQLTSGFTVRLIQPQQNWQIGTVRLVVYLQVQTPTESWQFDLAQRSPSRLEADAQIENTQLSGAIIQTCDHAWCLHPIRLSELETAFWQQLDQHAPEIVLLRSATEVTVSSAESQGQLGALWLKVAFEFVAS